MFVSRSEVMARDSIQRESSVTGAKAIASSVEGSGAPSAAVRTNRSRTGPAAIPGSSGFHSVAGASAGPIARRRGPGRLCRNRNPVLGPVPPPDINLEAGGTVVIGPRSQQEAQSMDPAARHAPPARSWWFGRWLAWLFALFTLALAVCNGSVLWQVWRLREHNPSTTSFMR